jgi:hypothetical protein
MALVGLANYCSKSGGSYINAQYLPVEGVASFVPIINETTRRLLTVPILKDGYQWLSVPIFVGTDRPVSEKTTDSKQGTAYESRISVSIMPINPVVEVELETMKSLRYFLFKFSDRNGLLWLMGDLDFPAVFDYDYTGTKTILNFDCKSSRALRHIQI